MKIEHCEWSKDNGEDAHGNTIWYCAHRTFCPYEKCEVPKQKLKEVDTTDNIEVAKKKEKTANELTAEKYAELIPVIEKLVSEGINTWTGISRKLGINANTLRWYYNKHGIRFKGMKVCANDINWDKIVPIVRERRAQLKPTPWKKLAAEFNLNSEMLRVRMINYYDIN